MGTIHEEFAVSMIKKEKTLFWILVQFLATFIEIYLLAYVFFLSVYMFYCIRVDRF